LTLSTSEFVVDQVSGFLNVKLEVFVVQLFLGILSLFKAFLESPVQFLLLSTSVIVQSIFDDL
jgi:hypothetical protein